MEGGARMRSPSSGPTKSEGRGAAAAPAATAISTTMLRVHAARYGGSEGARDFSVDDGEEAASVTEDRRRMETMDREEEDEGDFARLRNVHYLDHAAAAAVSPPAVLF